MTEIIIKEDIREFLIDKVKEKFLVKGIEDYLICLTCEKECNEKGCFDCDEEEYLETCANCSHRHCHDCIGTCCINEEIILCYKCVIQCVGECNDYYHIELEDTFENCKYCDSLCCEDCIRLCGTCEVPICNGCWIECEDCEEPVCPECHPDAEFCSECEIYNFKPEFWTVAGLKLYIKENNIDFKKLTGKPMYKLRRDHLLKICLEHAS